MPHRGVPWLQRQVPARAPSTAVTTVGKTEKGTGTNNTSIVRPKLFPTWVIRIGCVTPMRVIPRRGFLFYTKGLYFSVYRINWDSAKTEKVLKL